MTTTTTRTETRKFDLKTIDDAPRASRPLLEQAEKSFGFVPNLYRVFADSPVALSSYMAIAKALQEHGTLSPTEQQLVMLTISRQNECGYCVAAHSTVGEKAGLSEGSIDAIREDRSLDDPRLEALRRFTKKLVSERGWVSDEAIRELMDAGYEKRQVLELIAIMAMKTLSNFTNHVAETPLDEAFRGKRWQKRTA